MRVSRDAIVTEARSWIDTPWHHNSSTKGLACDCGGLLRGVMINLGIMPADMSLWPEALTYKDYKLKPDGKTMIAACEVYLKRITRAMMQPGDVVVTASSLYPQHLGIISSYWHGGLSIIHATNALSVQPARVIEMRLLFGKTLQFKAAYRFPGVE